MRKQKRIAAIHDISCFGKCSLTVALPILSAAGMEACCIPTAVLSTHTGGFSDYTYRDLTEDMLPVAEHWSKLGLRFDAVYTGYLGSERQTAIVEEVLSALAGENTLVIVDPVMGDNGRLYAGFTPDFAPAMAKLCSRADVIVPNITEACLLLGQAYHEGPYQKNEIEDMLLKLSKLGPKQIVLTGVRFDEESLGAATFEAATGRCNYVMREKLSGMYHGTGDVYASALTAALLGGFTLEAAATVAADFTVLSIRATRDLEENIHYGVNFEQCLPELLHMLKKEASE